MTQSAHHRDSVIAHVFEQPAYMFVLYAIGTGFCTSNQDFERHFSTFPADTAIHNLKVLGVVDDQDARLTLTDLGRLLIPESLTNEYTDAQTALRSHATHQRHRRDPRIVETSVVNEAASLPSVPVVRPSSRAWWPFRRTHPLITTASVSGDPPPAQPTTQDPVTPSTPMPLHEILRLHRVAAHLTQSDLAATAGIAVRTLSDIEQARSHPRPATIRRLADALSLSDAERETLAQAANLPRAHATRRHIQLTSTQSPVPPEHDELMTSVVHRDIPSPPTSQVTPARREPSVFISFSHTDSDFAHKLAGDLAASGVAIWMYPAGVLAGDFVVEVNRWLARSDWLVLVLTPAALRSSWVRQELNVALQSIARGTMFEILPVIASPDVQEIPPHLAGRKRFDATQDYESALEDIKRALGLSTKREYRLRRVSESVDKYHQHYGLQATASLREAHIGAALEEADSDQGALTDHIGHPGATSLDSWLETCARRVVEQYVVSEMLSNPWSYLSTLNLIWTAQQVCQWHHLRYGSPDPRATLGEIWTTILDPVPPSLHNLIFDQTSDACERIISRLNRFDGQVSLDTWRSRVLRNTLSDTAMRASRIARLEQSLDAPPQHSDQAEPDELDGEEYEPLPIVDERRSLDRIDDLLDLQGVLMDLSRVLSELGEPMRTICELRLRGVPAKVVAKECGVPSARVAQVFFTFKQRVRNRLNQ